MDAQLPLYARAIKVSRVQRLFLNQTEFAELIAETADRLGHTAPCDQSTVSKWERGITVPQYRYRAAIAEAIGIDADTLFGEVAA